MYLYYQFLANFNITDETTAIIILAFAAVVLLTIILRIVICIGYQAQYGMFTIQAKDLKAKSDISSIKRGVVSKVAKDYINSCEKGASQVNTSAIVNKHLLRLRFILWSYDSIHRFIIGMEASIILTGVLLAVFTDYPIFFGVLAIALFLLTKILAMTFDYELVKSKFIDEVTEYVEREIGQFYIVDLKSGIYRLNTSLVEGAANQSAVLSQAIEKLGIDLSGVLRLIIGDIQKGIEESINKINSYSDVLQKPISQWQSTLNSASNYQENINQASTSLSQALSSIEVVSTNMEHNFMLYTDKLQNEKEIISHQIDNLQAVAASIRESSQSGEASKKSLEGVLGYVEKNQIILEESLNKYELALENLTTKLGDAMGSIMNYHIEQSYQNLNSDLKENINLILQSNSELITRMQQLFERLAEHAKSETQAILKINDQMDLHFNALNERIL